MTMAHGPSKLCAVGSATTHARRYAAMPMPPLRTALSSRWPRSFLAVFSSILKILHIHCRPRLSSLISSLRSSFPGERLLPLPWADWHNFFFSASPSSCGSTYSGHVISNLQPHLCPELNRFERKVLATPFFLSYLLIFGPLNLAAIDLHPQRLFILDFDLLPLDFLFSFTLFRFLSGSDVVILHPSRSRIEMICWFRVFTPARGV